MVVLVEPSIMSFYECKLFYDFEDIFSVSFGSICLKTNVIKNTKFHTVYFHSLHILYLRYSQIFFKLHLSEIIYSDKLKQVFSHFCKIDEKVNFNFFF